MLAVNSDAFKNSKIDMHTAVLVYLSECTVIFVVCGEPSLSNFLIEIRTNCTTLQRLFTIPCRNIVCRESRS